MSDLRSHNENLVTPTKNAFEIDLDRALDPELLQPAFQHEEPKPPTAYPVPSSQPTYQPIEIEPHSGIESNFKSNNVSKFNRKGTAPEAYVEQHHSNQHAPQQIATYTAETTVLDPPYNNNRFSSMNAGAFNEVSLIRKKLATDSKTSTEYTLHILFTQFVRHAERKLNMSLSYPLNTEPPIVDLLAEGVDPDFDKIIASLGYISKTNPKPVIDSVMFWRKSKSEVAAMAADAAENAINALKEHKESAKFRREHSHSSSSVSRFSHRRNNSSKSNIQHALQQQQQDPKLTYLESQVHTSRETAIQGERKSIISIYILCRVLIEVVKQVNFETTNDDLGDKLEEIVFSQLRSTDPIMISSSIIRSANWNLFAELLGYMSEMRFFSVSDRFIADLEKIPPVVPKDIEPSIHLLIHGMRYLRLKNYPLEDFEEGADFLLSIAKFFSATKSHSIRQAYLQVLTHLLLPLADLVTAEVNHPTWSEAIRMIYNSCDPIDINQKSWLTNFNLVTSALCVSPVELFAQEWSKVIDLSIKNLKNKHILLDEKIAIVTSISRLLWVYVFRCPDSLNNTTRNVNDILNSLFFGRSKPSWLVTDVDLISPITQIFRAVCVDNFNNIVESYIIRLIKSGFNGKSLDNLQHERIILAVKAYITMLADNEHTRKTPPFPENLDSIGTPSLTPTVKNEEDYAEICSYFDSLLSLLDSAIGPNAPSENRTPTTPFYYSAKSPFSNFKFGSDFSVQTTRNLHTETLAVLVEASPWLGRHSMRKTVELLCRNSLNSDFRVSNASSTALKLLATRKDPSSIISTFAKYAFNFTERSGYSQDYFISKELLRLYLNLLENWLKSIQKRKEETTKSEFTLSLKDKEDEEDFLDDIQLKNTITVIEEVEGHGLFFLASQDFEIRKIGLSILRITESFDEALYEQTTKAKPKQNHTRSNSRFAADIGTRVYFIIQSVDFYKLIGSQKQHLSVAERSRLSKLGQKQRRNLLAKLAESDYGVDSALWFRVFPKLISTIFEKCPITVALCRSIVCTRLVQIHEAIAEIAESPRSSQKLMNGPPEVLVDQWKIYLIVACISLTSTSEQRLHIPEITAYGKKKSQQLLTIQHSTITSARSIFSLTLNLLNGPNQVVRDAIITGLSCMNMNIFRTFIESVDMIFVNWEKELGTNFHSKDSRLRIEVTHVLNIVSKFMEEEAVISDDWIVGKLVGFLKIIKAFLSQSEVQHSFEFQKLRRYFCGLLENIFTGIQQRKDSSEWLPFEARVSSFAFLEEWCGYGKSSIISKQRYAQMTKHISNPQELTALNSAIEFEKQIMVVAATNAMVSLLSGKIQEIRGQTILKFDLPGLLSWIDLLFGSQNEKIQSLAKKALDNLFRYNPSDKDLFYEVFRKCIADQNVYVIENYNVVVCDALVKSEEFLLKNHQVLLFGLYGIGFSSSKIRQSAIELLIALEKRLYSTEVTTTFVERVKNKNKTIYKRALLDISTYFASSFPDHNIFLISELNKYFHIVSFESRRDLLTILLPWLHTVELQMGEANEVDIKTYMILSNLLEITVKFSETIPNEIEALWISLGNGNSMNNIQVILKYCIQTSLNKRNPLFVEFASKVLVYISGANTVLSDSLISYIDNKNMVPPKPSLHEPPKDDVGLPYIADIWKSLNYSGKESVFSLGQLALIFLSDMVVIPNEAVTAKIPLLLQASFVLLDHYLPIVQESASKLVIYILGTVSSHPKLEETKNLVRNNQKCLWVYDDLNNDKNGARSPKDMDLLVRNILEIFSSTYPNIQEDWGRVALSWATNCAVRHIACRSFQVFRSLLSFLDQSMLRDMLHRLSNTISDETSDIQGFSMQILMTLNAITSELDPEKLIDFPQLFWATVASLNTINEHEYIELLSVLSKFLSKIDLDSEDTVSCLVATFPMNWEGKFEGLQQIIMIGLRSSASWDASLQLLENLNKLKDSEIIAGESRLLFAVLSNLPRYLHAMAEGYLSPEIISSAQRLIAMANAKNQTNLARIMESFCKNKFRSTNDFLRQTVNQISENFLNDYSGQTVIFLLGLLSNKIDWVKIETMRILKVLFPKVDLSEPQFQGCGADLISPLLRLLLTPYAQQALEVLDETASISGSKLDKDILRMSLGNKAIKKDYEKTATLFGIPEDSGWSIPMPAITAATTRNNVHAVFSSCVVMVESEAPEEQEQIKFHLEDYQYSAHNNHDGASVIEEAEGSLSHMWAELDHLDSFFTKDNENMSQYSGNTSTNDAGHHFRSTSVDTRFSNTDNITPYESAPQIYDKKVSVILNRSLARTQSNTSFKTSLADSFANSPVSEGRHLSSLSTREIYSSIRSPNQGPSSPTSPTSSSLAREDSFRFENILGQAQRQPKKIISRFSQTPEYLPNWSNSTSNSNGNHTSHNGARPTIREKSSGFSLNRMSHQSNSNTNGTNHQ